MKRTASLFLTIFLLTGCAKQPVTDKSDIKKQDETIKAVWIFYRELSMAEEKGGNAESFKKKIDGIFDNCVSLGINTVFFHVRPFADSFYPSDIFPLSEYLTGTQGANIDYDPLEIAVNSAHCRDISIHAWINPFRISFSTDFKQLAVSNPARKLFEDGSKLVCKTENGLYFNPSSAENHKLIIDGVREIVKNYNVDGIHIDDYFYPSTDESIDKAQYDLYKSKGGGMNLFEWRIQCINSFVSSLYNSVKSIDKNVVVSVSPAGNIDNNYNSLYADVRRWGSVKGYCDWLIPQLYYSFENETLPYKNAADEWRKITSCSEVKLIAGLGVYKAVEGDNDWTGDSVIEREWNYAEKCDYDGYALFSYSSIVSSDFKEKNTFFR